MGSFTRISVAPREPVAFGFNVSNLSLKSFSLFLSVLQVSLPSVQIAKQGAASCRMTTVTTQSSALVAQLVFALP
jgi:hypothetical protein